jgi:hypothetical protein
MPANLLATGKIVEMKGDKYTRQSAYLRRGDILVTKTSGHTVVVLTDGPKAESDVPLKLGDRDLKKGCEGDDVRALQAALLAQGYSLPKYGADGDFGSETEDVGTPAGESAGESTKELDIGTRYDSGFVMDLPEGFRFDEGWSCYQTDKVQAWIRDADFYEFDHNFEDVLSDFDVTGPGEPLGPFTLWGETYKRPKADRGELLNPWYNRRHVSVGREQPYGGVMYTPELPQYLADRFAEFMPFYLFLQEVWNNVLIERAGRGK